VTPATSFRTAMGALQTRGTPRSIHSRPLAFSIAAPARNLTQDHQIVSSLAGSSRWLNSL